MSKIQFLVFYDYFQSLNLNIFRSILQEVYHIIKTLSMKLYCATELPVGLGGRLEGSTVADTLDGSWMLHRLESQQPPCKW